MVFAALCKFICWIIAKLPSLLLCLLCPIITCFTAITIKALKALGAGLLALIQLICCVVKCCIKIFWVFVWDCVLKGIFKFFSTSVVAGLRLVVQKWSEFVEMMVYVWINMLKAGGWLVNAVGELIQKVVWLINELMKLRERAKDYINYIRDDIIPVVLEVINRCYNFVVEKGSWLVGAVWSAVEEFIKEFIKEAERVKEIVRYYRHYLQAKTPVILEEVSTRVNKFYNHVRVMVFLSLDAVVEVGGLVQETMLAYKEVMKLMLLVLRVVITNSIEALFDLVVDVFWWVAGNRYFAFLVVLMLLVTTLLIYYQCFRNRTLRVDGVSNSDDTSSRGSSEDTIYHSLSDSN